MSPETGLIIGAAIGLSGTIVTTIVQLVNSKRDKDSEERKHYRDLLFKVGFDWWKYEQESSGVRFPFEEYLVRMDAFYAMFIEENPDEHKAKKKHALLNAFLEERSKRLAKHDDPNLPPT